MTAHAPFDLTVYPFQKRKFRLFEEYLLQYGSYDKSNIVNHMHDHISCITTVVLHFSFL